MTQTHNRRYFGRPKAHLTQLRELAEARRPLLRHKIEAEGARVAAILDGLPADQRAALDRHHTALQDDHALAGFVLALAWVLGEGLRGSVLRRVLTEEWGTEILEPRPRDGGE